MRVVAFDQSSGRTGWAVFDNVGRGPTLVAYGSIKLGSKWTAGHKLFAFDEEVCELLKKYQPKWVVYESPHVRFPAAGIAIGKIVGIIERQAYDWRCGCIGLTATSVRRLIGNKVRTKGDAKKIETRRIVCEKFNIELPDDKNYDESDAIALGWASFAEIRREGKK